MPQLPQRSAHPGRFEAPPEPGGKPFSAEESVQIPERDFPSTLSGSAWPALRAPLREDGRNPDICGSSTVRDPFQNKPDLYWRTGGSTDRSLCHPAFCFSLPGFPSEESGSSAAVPDFFFLFLFVSGSYQSEHHFFLFLSGSGEKERKKRPSCRQPDG